MGQAMVIPWLRVCWNYFFDEATILRRIRDMNPDWYDFREATAANRETYLRQHNLIADLDAVLKGEHSFKEITVVGWWFGEGSEVWGLDSTDGHETIQYHGDTRWEICPLAFKGGLAILPHPSDQQLDEICKTCQCKRTLTLINIS